LKVRREHLVTVTNSSANLSPAHRRWRAVLVIFVLVFVGLDLDALTNVVLRPHVGRPIALGVFMFLWAASVFRFLVPVRESRARTALTLGVTAGALALPSALAGVF